MPPLDIKTAAITGGLAQRERLLKLDTALGGNVLLPRRVVARSRIGRHFEFTVDVISSGIELKKLIAASPEPMAKRS